MSAPVPVEPEAREYDQVAAGELDTRYSKLRLPSPQAEGALSRSIARHGVLQPLTVNQESDVLAVLDGFKRLRVLGEDPEMLVAVRIVALTAPQAKAALVTFNRPHRGVSELEEAWVVQALVCEHEMLQKDVAELLGHHKSWVCRRLQLAQQLEDSVVDDMRLGLISATVARELVRLPRGNQAEAAIAVERHGLTSRQTTEIVGRLLDAGDEDSKRELLDDPLRFLASQSSKALRRRDARLSDVGSKVRRSLDALARQARITERTIHAPRQTPLTCSDVDVLRPQVRDVVQTLDELRGTLNRLLDGDDDG